MSSQVTTTGVKLGAIARSTYLTELLAQCSSVEIGDNLLQELRQHAAAFVQEQTIPTTRDEEWRFTDLSPLLQVRFQAPKSVELAASEIAALQIAEAANSRLVFVNGVYAPSLSAVAGLPAGVYAGNLANLPSAYCDRLGNYLAQQPGAEEVFTALNTAGLTDVAVVWVPKNQGVDTPIHLLFISDAGEFPIITQPRCLVVAEVGSSVSLIEEYTNRQDAKNAKEEEKRVYLTNSVTEVWVGENAQVNHTRIQREDGAAFHIGKSAIAQARDSRYTCNAISLGAQLSRHNLEIFQRGEQTETTLNGLTVIGGEQLGDTHSAIALNYPYATSRQLHKCIVSDKAHAVFNGKIFVPKPAQLTDAGQLNRNLLLSPKARVDTKPQLEITADNVKCAHGATVSQLDDEEVFYLQSRGLNQANARNLLINAFAIEIIERIPVASVRDILSQMVKNQKTNNLSHR